MREKIKYIKGQKFGNITFIEDLSKSPIRKAVFKCFCGEYFIAQINSIKRGNTKSCGCYNKKVSKESNTTHGDCGTSLYGIWASMKSRCFNSNHKRFKDYGGRGITVHKEWVQDYQKFKDWILDNLGEKPKGLTLDRINNNGNYEPNNLRWATHKQQNNNRRDNIL